MLHQIGNNAACMLLHAAAHVPQVACTCHYFRPPSAPVFCLSAGLSGQQVINRLQRRSQLTDAYWRVEVIQQALDDCRHQGAACARTSSLSLTRSLQCCTALGTYTQELVVTTTSAWFCQLHQCKQHAEMTTQQTGCMTRDCAACQVLQHVVEYHSIWHGG